MKKKSYFVQKSFHETHLDILHALAPELTAKSLRQLVTKVSRAPYNGWFGCFNHNFAFIRRSHCNYNIMTILQLFL